MPVISCGGGKFKIGRGKCIFKSRTQAEQAQRAIHAQRASKRRGKKK